jgi:hypothetical protein
MSGVAVCVGDGLEGWCEEAGCDSCLVSGICRAYAPFCDTEQILISFCSEIPNLSCIRRSRGVMLGFRILRVDF